MKITKTQLSQIVQEELQAVTAEGYDAYKRDDISGFELGRQHALAVSQGEMAEEDTYAKRLSDKDYERGFDEQTKELDSWDDEGSFDNDDIYENKITKSQLAQLVQEELKATLGEENSAEVDRVVSNMLQRDMTREELELLRMKLDDMIRQLSGDEEESAMALEGISKWINSKLNPKRPEATKPQRSEQAKEE